MSLLASEPAAPVRSLDELLAIAYRLEHEAAEHYAAFAAQARQEGLPVLAELFEKLAIEERHHEDYVQAWSQRQSGKAPDVTALRWEPPQTFDLAAGTELASSRLATAYRILAIAVQNEDRAFALWSYIAAQSEQEELRLAAETMARTELQHAWQLRRARRQAYHAEGHRQQSAIPSLDGLAVDEAHLASLLGDRAALTEGGIRDELRRLAEETRALAGSAAIHRSPVAATSDDILTLAERLADDYLELSDRSTDEAVVVRAQQLAERAVLRLAQLRAVGIELSGRMPDR